MRPEEIRARPDGGRPGGRRRDIDWLRIAAVLLLIPFHTARVFNWEEDFYIKNVPTGVVSQRFIDFVGPWHMSLLFLLAGVATWLAFRLRSGRQYAGERFKRLLIPFVFGVLVIVPPQTWLAYNTHHGTDLTYWEYLPKFFTTADEGLNGYAGGFTPGAPVVHPLPVRVLARRAAALPLAARPRRTARRERCGASVAEPRRAHPRYLRWSSCCRGS